MSRSERRGSKRRTTSVGGTFRRLAVKEHTATMDDFSSGGASFVTDDPPGVGDLIEFKAGEERTAIGEVAYVKPRKDAPGYLFGIRFLDEGADQDSTENFAAVAKPSRMNETAFEYHERLERLQAFVTEHLEEKIPLEKAAGLVAMEKTYFSSFFREKVGITFTDWLQYLRIKRATEHIRTSDCTITEAALQCGFQDLRTFERTFYKWLEMTPRAYKKLVS